MSKIIPFASPVDASKYVAGLGLAKGIALKTTDYEANVYRFSLVQPDDTVWPVVNGVNPADLLPGALVDENDAAAHVRAVIAETNQ